jgi:nitroreductase
MESALEADMTHDSILHLRYSCRSFLPDPLSRETVEQLVDAARWAPNAGNVQPWRFVVATKTATKKGLSDAAHGQKCLLEAPVVIVVCALPEKCGRLYQERGRNLFCIQDTAAAAQNLLLAATMLGLGACWIGAFDEGAVSQALDLPPTCRPMVLVPVGRPAEKSTARTRLGLDEIVIWK